MNTAKGEPPSRRTFRNLPVPRHARYDSLLTVMQLDLPGASCLYATPRCCAFMPNDPPCMVGPAVGPLHQPLLCLDIWTVGCQAGSGLR